MARLSVRSSWLRKGLRRGMVRLLAVCLALEGFSSSFSRIAGFTRFPEVTAAALSDGYPLQRARMQASYPHQALDILHTNMKTCHVYIH